VPRVNYDEFSMFHENADEWALPYDGPPDVARTQVDVAPARQLSALQWGRTPPELVLLHGGAQNAHTFDTVALALRRPLLAIDLPGHGHSDGAPGGMSDVAGHARDVVTALGELGVEHVPVVGMSLGGLVALAVAALAPSLVARLGLIDVTPGVTAEKSGHITAFVHGPRTFASLDELVARTVEHNPTRSERSLRRGVLHNAVQLDDGTWMWRHQRFDAPEDPRPLDARQLWGALSDVRAPVLLVRAMGRGSVVDDDDEAEFRRRQPSATIVHVPDSGHSVQGDQPLILADVLAGFLDT
jgi:pimeloyl-ACP methyl ester carboxylesterase